MAIDRCFEHLRFWRDGQPRSGAENMAVDELLLRSETLKNGPILRMYEWVEESVSFGYFDDYDEAQKLFASDGLAFVRRMTGGGVVDHREDVTYSLIIPRGDVLAEARGGESYAKIHEALAQVLRQAGVEATLVSTDSAHDSAACFEKPVVWDLVNSLGQKLAGAGQRRSREGLLHQGSAQGVSLENLSQFLPAALSGSVEVWEPEDEGRFNNAMRSLVTTKYGRRSWLEERLV